MNETENKLYKYSQYNIEVDKKHNGDTLLFNTHSSKGGWIPREDYDDIKDNKSIDLGDVPVYLAKAGLIVSNEIDETKYINEDHKMVEKGTGSLDITIAVTRSCNYHCSYCFEINELGTGKISSETIDGVIKFIGSELTKHKYKRLKVVYFGGEPLLNIQAIKEISSKLHKITDIPIIGHITTNGRLLTADVAKELTDCGIKTAQVTLDGLPKEYAKLKGCTESDFYSVIENMKNVQDIIGIQIRLNVGNNKESIKKLIKYISDEGIKCKIYIDNIKYYNHSKDEFINDYQKYVESYKDIMNYVFENGYTEMFGRLYPVITCTACQANMPHYFSIDTDGNIYKCVDFMFKKEFIIGNVFDGITNDKLYKTFIDNPLYDKCYSCAYRPLCQGLCTTDRLILDKGVNCEALQEWYRFRIKKQIESIKR